MRAFLKPLVIVTAALGIAAAVSAQQRPDISGNIRIREGNAGQLVLVQLNARFGGVVARVTASSSGRFEFFGIRKGDYELVVEVPGYKIVRLQIEYSIFPVDGILVDLVPEGKPADEAAGPTVPMRVLQSPPKAREEYEKGVESMRAKKLEESVAHFRKAIEIHPEFDEAYLQLGMIHLQQNNAAQAQSAFENVTRIQPQSERGFMLLGRAYRLQKKLEEATQALEQSIKLKEDSWFAQAELGEALVGLGRVDAALPHVARAHELNKMEPALHQLYYNTLIRRNQHREALAELDEFLDLFPMHSMATRARQQREALQKFLDGQGKQ